MGIKTLSPFSIPGINDFRGDGRIKKIFEEEYVEARLKILKNGVSAEYHRYLEQDYEDGKLRVHDRYLSGDRGSREAREAKGVDIILKDKERLLSPNEPLRFIFSVWALREGWDNPDIFNICKLSHSTKDNSRRQQVGRGLRIALDKQNMRMTEDRLAERKVEFHAVNELNMVVPAYESTFIRDIHDASPSIASPRLTLDSLKDVGLTDPECSEIFLKLLEHQIIDKDGNRLSSVREFLESNKDMFPQLGSKRLADIANTLQDTDDMVVDNNKRKTVRVRSGKWKEFKDLWEQINRDVRMVYKDIDEDDIILEVCSLFETEDIPPALAKVTRWVYDSDRDMVKMVEERVAGGPSYFQKSGFHENIVRIAQDHNWPIGFLVKLFNRIGYAKFRSNPEQAERVLTGIIQDAIHRTILEKVEYGFAEATVYGNGLQQGNGAPIRTIQSTKLGKFFSNKTPRGEFLYDTITYDSDIELRSIRNDPMTYGDDGHTRRITVFAKLPRIDIPTPYKTYNPDFAYVISNGGGKALFLVVETKGYDNHADIPGAERRKIEYGRKFFESLRKVLPGGVELCFRERLNRDGMANMLRECYTQ